MAQKGVEVMPKLLFCFWAEMLKKKKNASLQGNTFLVIEWPQVSVPLNQHLLLHYAFFDPLGI